MMIPLQQFLCDTCGGIIEKPEDGWVEWLTISHPTMTYINHGFRICHHDSTSPRRGINGCYKYADNIDVSDNHLNHFIDDRYKLAQLYSMIDIGPIKHPQFHGPQVDDLRDYVEFMRRLTIPYYEEARSYFSEAKTNGFFNDLNELDVYSPPYLQKLIEEYQ